MLLRSRSILRHSTAYRLYLLKCGHFHSSSASWRKVIQRFKLADIGEGITECEIIKWSVKPSASVSSFDPLCEVQSDKASVEITSPFDGVVKEILVQEGQVAKVGEGLCLIEIDEEVASDSPVVEPVDASSSQAPQETEAPAREPENKRESVKPEEPRRRPHPLDPNVKDEQRVATNDANVLATPSVRHFARSQGVDLAKLVPGSGKDGRIEKKDVEAWLSSSRTTQIDAPEPAQVGEDVVVELGRTRYGMWKAMTKSLEVPHFGYSTSLDITSLHALLPTLSAHIPLHYLPSSPTNTTSALPQAVSPSSLYPVPPPPDVPEGGRYKRLTYLPIFMKTLSKAMMEWPLFRSSLTSSSSASSPSDKPPKPTLTVRPQTDISLALSTPTGLYTPTISRVSSYSIYSLASHLAYLASLGRQVPCGLTVKEMPKRGGTISVSNIGAIGAGESAFPRLVEGGGVAIVVLGRAQWVWDVSKGEKGERRLKLPVSWSADHRIVEGAELAAFVECWRGYVEQPEKLIAEGV